MNWLSTPNGLLNAISIAIMRRMPSGFDEAKRHPVAFADEQLTDRVARWLTGENITASGGIR